MTIKNVHIGVSPLSHEIFVYRGLNGIAKDKSEPLTSEAVFSVAHLVLARQRENDHVTVMLNGVRYRLLLDRYE